MNSKFSLISASPTTTLTYAAITCRSFVYYLLKYFDLGSLSFCIDMQYCLVIKEKLFHGPEGSVCRQFGKTGHPPGQSFFLNEAWFFLTI